MKFAITQHAVERYAERVANVTLAEARRRLALCERAVLAAAGIGCKSIKLGCGARLALEGAKIVIVYPPHPKGSHFRPRSIRQDWRPE